MANIACIPSVEARRFTPPYLETHFWIKCKPILSGLLFMVAMLTAIVANADWSMLGGNAAHSFQSTESVPKNPVRLWVTRLEGGIYGSPVVRGKMLFVAGHDQRVSALNTLSGKVLWTYETGNEVSVTPVIAGDTIVVASKDGVVSALDVASGKQKWQVRTGEKILSSPVVDEQSDTVYLGSNDLFLYALRLSDGKVIWRYYAEDYRYGGLYVSPGLDKERVYIGAKNGVMHGVWRQTGKLAWQTELGSSMYDAPLVVGNHIYIGAYDRSIYALDALTGAIQWRRGLDEWPQGTPVLIGETLYVGTHAGTLYGIQVNNGTTVWQTSLGEELRHSFTVGANRIGVIGSLQGHMYGVDMNTHKKLWERNLGAAIFSAPALADNTIFVATTTGEISAWR
jgi:outer membrane protein assembly factor BamB